jgi:UDP-perosamine 4-acetyltransferase
MEINDQYNCVILGGGGHASVLIEILQTTGLAVPRAILDPDRSRWGSDLLGVPILGGDDKLSELADMNVTHFLVGLGSTGDNRHRRRLFELGLSCKMTPLTVKHPSAFCSSMAQIGPGSQLFPVSIVNTGASLGTNVIVNSGAIVEHDCILGNHVHIATGARLASTIKIGDGAHVGVGASVRQLISIGEGAVVGAGAVVVEDVPDWTIVVGVPAEPIKGVEGSMPK